MPSAPSHGIVAVRRASGLRAKAFRGSAWAVADQGIVSASSFLINLMLARSLSATDYGIVVLAFGGVFVLQAIHRSLILYPLSLRLAGAAETRVQSLAKSSAALSLPVSTLLAVVAGAVTLATSRNSDTAVVIGSTVLVSQLYETLRWILLSRLHHPSALLADSIRNGCAVLAIAWHAFRGTLTVHDVFVNLTGGAMVGAIWLLLRTRLWRGSANDVRDLAADAWVIGRWDLIGGGVTSVTVQILPWTLAAWHGPATTAQLQAVANLLGATHPVLFGLSNLVTPAVAQSAALSESVRQTVSRYSFIGSVALIPYLALLFLFPRITLETVYGGGSQYVGTIAALRWFVVIYLFLFLLNTVQAALNGLRRSRDVSFISFAGLILHTAITAPLAIKYGLVEACAGNCIAQIIHSVIGLKVLLGTTHPVEMPTATKDTRESQQTA